MILLVVLAFALVVGLLRGGKLSQMVDLPLKLGWLALLAFAIQVYLTRFPADRGGGLFSLRAGVLILSYVLLFVVVWKNRRITGLWIIGLGLLLNFLVMVANGGFMPITPEALTQAGYASLASSLESGVRVGRSKNILLAREETRLWVLSDTFVLPRSFPLSRVFSPGDIVIAIGAFILVQSGMLGQSQRASP